MKISIITPSIRAKGLQIVLQSLKNQTLQDFEWLVGSSFDPKLPEAVWVKDDFQGGYWTLNRVMSKMCRQAKGELLVFWQDFIWIPPQGLEKFYFNWKETGCAISGIGDQYARLNAFGKPEVKIWIDPRHTTKYGSFYECGDVADWELNWACVGRKYMESAKFFPDVADFQGYGADNVMMAERLSKAGVRFMLDQTNESFTLQHGRERKDWNEHYIMNTDYFRLRKYL